MMHERTVPIGPLNGMELRLRKDKPLADLESGGLPSELQSFQNQNAELEVQLANQKKLLELARLRERKLAKMLDEMGVSHDVVELSDDFQDFSFRRSIIDRSSWLIGLLVFQSLSSFVLRRYESLLQHHPSIVYFLTMLVGAGGNAGNQATVRAIRGIALGTLSKKTAQDFVKKELLMGLILSGVVGVFGFLRVFFLSTSSYLECVAISIALVVIVFASIVIGAVLPIAFQLLGIDPAHSSTTIQVVMDISGVIITCFVATQLLNASISSLPTGNGGDG